MILGTGPLADGARAAFPTVPFYWLLNAPIPDDIPTNSLVVISHPQLVGTTARHEAEFPNYRFAYVPENVRESHPEDWITQARFVIGTRHPSAARELSGFFHPAIIMSPESAEMVKHGINGFLASSIWYAKQLAQIAAAHGADPEDVARGLMTDPRIGSRAYLRPHGAVSEHLRREVDNLAALGMIW